MLMVFIHIQQNILESNQTEFIIPAKLNEKTLNELQEIAAEIFTRLKCKGMARVDFFVNDQTW